MSNKFGSINGVGPSRVFLPTGSYPSLLDFLVARFPAGSRQGWAERLRQGNVLNQLGEPLAVDSPYLPGQHIYYYRQLRQESPIPFKENIVYQDDYIVIADKPHYLPISPVGPFLQETLLVRLRNRLGIETLNSAHRIDLETAGLVLFTIKSETRGAYQNLFRDQKIDKYYEAIAPLKAGLTYPLRYQSCLEESDAFMQMREVVGLPNSETVIELLESKGDWGKYRLTPITGKKHQLRAHMNALGMPIKNDQIYPVLKQYIHPEHRDYSQPLQLLAQSLSFTDPFTKKNHTFQSGLSLEEL